MHLLKGDGAGFDDGRALRHDGPHWNQAECRARGHPHRFRRHRSGIHRARGSGMGDLFVENVMERQHVYFSVRSLQVGDLMVFLQYQGTNRYSVSQ